MLRPPQKLLRCSTCKQGLRSHVLTKCMHCACSSLKEGFSSLTMASVDYSVLQRVSVTFRNPYRELTRHYFQLHTGSHRHSTAQVSGLQHGLLTVRISTALFSRMIHFIYYFFLPFSFTLLHFSALNYTPD